MVKVLIRLHKFMVCLCPPEPHYRRGGESGGGSVLRWSEQEALAVERSATVYHVSAGCPPGLKIHTGQSPLLYSVVWYIHVYVLIFLICPPQVFPPVPVMLDYSFFDRRKNHLGLLPKEDKPCPCYIAPIKGNVFQTFFKYINTSKWRSFS